MNHPSCEVIFPKFLHLASFNRAVLRRNPRSQHEGRMLKSRNPAESRAACGSSFSQHGEFFEFPWAAVNDASSEFQEAIMADLGTTTTVPWGLWKTQSYRLKFFDSSILQDSSFFWVKQRFLQLSFEERSNSQQSTLAFPRKNHLKPHFRPHILPSLETTVFSVKCNFFPLSFL